MISSTRVRFALVLLGAIIVPGLANYVLVQNGFETLGIVVWGLGYGSGILVLWYVWLRPLDLTGPQGSDPREADNRTAESDADQPR